MMSKVKRVGIVGAGPSGLAAIKACLEEGFQPTAFERREQIGGIWVYRETDEEKYSEISAVYQVLKTNTSKGLFGFTDFPCPAGWTPYVSHQKCLEYFQDYAEQFKLSKHIHFNCDVLKVFEDKDHEVTGRWRLIYHSNGKDVEEVFDAVMICTAFYARAILPKYPGQDLFQGDICTGSTYRKNHEYTDKNVLIVGSSISAGDIATDVSNTTKQTYISSRNGFFLEPVIHSNGWPMDVMVGRRFLQFSNWLKAWMINRENYKIFRSEELGLKRPADGKLYNIIMNDNFILQVMCGKLKPMPAIQCFTKTGVVFTDGTIINDLDAVMFCTGYHSSIPIVDENCIPDSLAQRDMYSMVFPVHMKHQTLVCIGFFKNIAQGSPITALEMQTRWVAQVWADNSLLPSKREMIAEVQQRRRHEHAHYGKNVFAVAVLPYMDTLAKRIGCYPSLIPMLFSDPRLVIHMYFGPIVPASYRLVGPHKWKGARNAILGSWDKIFEATSTTTSKKLTTRLSNKICLMMMLLLAVIFLFLWF